MFLLSHLHRRFARIFKRLHTGDESYYLPDDDGDGVYEDDWPELSVLRWDQDVFAKISMAEVKKWARPKQLPISAETVFLCQVRAKNPERSFRKTIGSTTIDDAWNGLSLGEREWCMAKANENEIHNTTELAKFNKSYPLSPPTGDLTREWIIPWVPRSGLGGRLVWLRYVMWNRYRFDHLSACGGRKTLVLERPFRIMYLPFELRRDILTLVLRFSYPVLQFPSDGSADVVQGPVDVRIFAVSRQMFAEAVKIFYEVNTFGIHTKRSSFLKALPLFIRQSTGNEAPRPTNLIRSVQVNFHLATGAPTDTDEFGFLWKRFCEFLETCRSLRTFEISARRVRHGSLDGALDRHIDRLAEMMKIRSTTGAVFSEVTTYEPLGPRLHDYWRVRRIVGIIV